MMTTVEVMTDSSINVPITEGEDELPVNVKLYHAAVKGDWKTAKSIFDRDSSAVTMKINDQDQTVLHIAATEKQVGFVEKLVKLMPSSYLTLTDKSGHTAIHDAAVSGVVRIAVLMLEKHPDLLNILDKKKTAPVVFAVFFKQKDMASFLFSNTKLETLETLEPEQTKTPEPEQTETPEPEQIVILLRHTIYNDYYDIALDILKMKPELATEKLDDDGHTALHLLARKPSIGSSSELIFWKRYINSCFKGIYNKDLMQTFAHQLFKTLWKTILQHHSNPDDLLQFIGNPTSLLHDAARVGNVELLIMLSYSCPDLLHQKVEVYKSIFHSAIENRQESVFSLIHEIEGLRKFMQLEYDQKNNINMLHMAAKLAAPDHLNRVSGAALQMQREILWFKEVEKLVFYSDFKRMKCLNIEMKNNQIEELRLTPYELFTKEHKQLLEDGEKWMKSTADSCMLVATLIATVVFAAAFTVPGGNDNNTGTPIFRRKDPFTVFVISDITALISSTTSILIFLSILMSRYTADDFLVSLPTKLLFGLITLFFSIVCMVVAFSATFFMVYDEAKGKNIPFVVAMVAVVPISCFCVLNYKLVVDVLRAVYGSKFSFRRRKKRLL